MMPQHGYNLRLKTSLEKALDVLGEPSKKTLMFYVTEQCGISFESNCSIPQIESALKGILGAGSKIITDMMYSDLERIPE
jgi:hypothetical protein